MKINPYVNMCASRQKQVRVEVRWTISLSGRFVAKVCNIFGESSNVIHRRCWHVVFSLKEFTGKVDRLRILYFSPNLIVSNDYWIAQRLANHNFTTLQTI